MDPDMKAEIQNVRKLVESKEKLLLDKSFDSEDNGELFPSQAVHKIIDILNMGLQKLSHTLTKMTILLSERPLPKIEDMTSLYSELSQEINQFYEIFTTVHPIYCGVLLKEMYNQICIQAFEAIDEVLNEVVTDVYNKEKLLKANGCLWEVCQKFQSLPRDMVQLCLYKCQVEYDTLVDAEEELKNEIKEHQESDFNFDDSSWSDEDLKLLTPSTGLIKAAHSVCKKLRDCVQRSGRLDSKHQINDVEKVCRAVQTLSPGVDDLVTSLYPPLVKKQVSIAAHNLLSALKSILSNLTSAHFITDTDVKWIDFLQKAIEHNSAKLLDGLEYTAADVTSEIDDISLT